MSRPSKTAPQPARTWKMPLKKYLVVLRALQIVLVGVGHLCFPTSAAAQSFPLMCLGRAQVQFDSHVRPGQNVDIHVPFSAATQAATSATLKPGQCGWLDRVLRPGEPTTLCIPFGIFVPQWSVTDNSVNAEYYSESMSDFFWALSGLSGPSTYSVF